MASQQLHIILTDLSHKLTIPDDILKQGDEYMQKVFLILQKHSRYALSRCRLLGGVGKKTSISLKFDYDCVIYVNDIEPPFEKILDEWEDILTLKFSNPIEKTRVTQCSIQFEIEGFKFDILPATNYAGVNHNIHHQAEHIWEIISKYQHASNDKKISHLYSSGLSELTMQFMQKQTGFVHDLCRLAKFWNGTIRFELYVSGRSSIIEYLAVKAGQEEEQAAVNSEKSMLRAFRRFLSYLTKNKQIAVVFTDFYKTNLVPNYQKPYLIDPANPFNNYLDGIPDRFLPTLAEYSQVTLDRLEKCEKNFSIEFEKLFDPQPDLQNLFPDIRGINCIVTMIGSCQNCKEKLPKLIERRQTFSSPALALMKEFMASVLKYLSISITSTAKSEEDIDEKINNATEEFLNRSLYKHDHRWVPTTRKHEDCDITFILPLNTEKQDAIYISMTK